MSPHRPQPFKSCALNGVTLTISIQPFVIPSIIQKAVINIRTKTRLLTKYTSKNVINIKYVLNKNVQGEPTIQSHAAKNECLEIDSITRLIRHAYNTCSKSENRFITLQTGCIFLQKHCSFSFPKLLLFEASFYANIL